MIIGISGYARVGKDTFGSSLCKILKEYGIKCETIALADSLKEKIANFIWTNFKISAYSQETELKKIIRPMLVSFGESKRIQDPNFWITECEKKFISGTLYIITDIRYENEAEWIISKNGFLLNLNRQLPDLSFVSSPNKEESQNAPLVQKKCSFDLTWQTVDEETIEKIVDSFIISILANRISEWKATFPL